MSPQAQQEQLNEIANMPRGWDSYDASPINKRAILEARRIVSWMPNYWTIVPRADGALQLERHAGGLNVECVITGDISTPETPPECPDCFGEGAIPMSTGYERRVCTYCNGSGRIASTDHKGADCPQCTPANRGESL